MSTSYKPKYAGTIDAIVEDKMTVLFELCVADHCNYDKIRDRLISEIRKNPEMDPQRVADRVARTLIYERFDKD